MVYKQDPTYLWLKGSTYYFNRHIPFDIQPHAWRGPKTRGSQRQIPL